jgi:CubicO group peptidase (beta-lactamase class C family)
MLRNGGTLDGRRILSRTTVELMTTSHLGDIEFNTGQGFGLGFYIVEDVGARGSPGSVGEFGWGGAYHTTYWVDPREELVVVHLTQLATATSTIRPCGARSPGDRRLKTTLAVPSRSAGRYGAAAFVRRDLSRPAAVCRFGRGSRVALIVLSAARIML